MRTFWTATRGAQRQTKVDPLRVALVGSGGISDLHYAAMQRSAGMEVVGLYHPRANSRSLSERRERWGLPVWHDYAELLAQGNLDAVAIVSPTHLHAEQALAAARAKKHVLLEKPIALELDDIDKLILAERENGVVIMPGHNFAYRPVVRRAKQLIDEGALGTISYASFRTVHFLDPNLVAGWRASHEQAGGGAMIDSGMHLAYQSLYLLGAPTKLCAFTARRHAGIADEDVCQVAMQYPGGALGYLFQSWAADWDDTNEIRVHGSKASLCIQNGLFLGGKKLEKDYRYEDSFYHLAEAFHAAVREKVTPLSTLHDAKLALRLVYEAYASAEHSEVRPFTQS